MPTSLSTPTWVASSLAILLFAAILPGVSLIHFSAILLAVAFGAANAYVKPVLRYLDVPITPFTLGVFCSVPNMALVFWATIGYQSIFIGSIVWAALYVVALSATTAYLTLNGYVLYDITLWVRTLYADAAASITGAAQWSAAATQRFAAIMHIAFKTPSHTAARAP